MESVRAALGDELEHYAVTAFAETMGYAPTNSTVKLPADLAKLVDYTEEQRKSLMVQKMDYLAKNDAALQDWWNKSFKG